MMTSRNIVLVMVTGALCGLGAGCSSKDKREQVAAPQPTAQEQAIAQLTTERDTYVKDTNTKIDRYQKFAQNLRIRSSQTADRPRSKKIEIAASDMSSLIEDMRRELADVQTAAPQNWLDEKRDTDKEMARIETQYSNAMPLLQ